MTDIVERLLKPIDPDDPNLWKVDKDRLDAANEIETLRGRLAHAEFLKQQVEK